VGEGGRDSGGITASLPVPVLGDYRKVIIEWMTSPGGKISKLLLHISLTANMLPSPE